MPYPDVLTLSGLATLDAKARLESEGYNELPSSKTHYGVKILLDILREPMLILLMITGSVYLLIGDPRDALMLLTFVMVVLTIIFYQRQKTERALMALKSLASPRAIVIRDGEEKRIPGREVVRDDILVLQEGDRVAADARLMSSSNLLVDESLLTGESMPVRKIASAEAGSFPLEGPPGGDDLSMVYAGTLVIRGHGIARVTAIGYQSEMGKIGKSLQAVPTQKTPLQIESRVLVRHFATIGISICIVIILIYGLLRADWPQGFLAGIAFAMAILPEEIPVVMTVFLALGAWRMSKVQVLTRNAQAIETLGSATVLCVDKTGTLTLNQMTLTQLYANNAFFSLEKFPTMQPPENFHSLLEFSLLASRRTPFDPMETALKHQGEALLKDTEHLHDNWLLVNEYPLSEKLLAMSQVWRSPDEKDFIIAAKGSPEAIMDLCHLDKAQSQAISAPIQAMANEGLRLLGVAKAYFCHPNLPYEQHDFNFEFLGLLGFIDPVRPSVPQAIQQCHQAGIRVIMITGDYPGTARHIANRVGLPPESGVMTGAELESLSDTQLQQRMQDTAIFARVSPSHKLRIVSALKANGEIVAMTGDGVNDAPALKAAHIGIAMGKRGTDVAREAASLVLLDEDFSSIVHAIEQGRRIFDNLRKALGYLIAIHVPIAGIALIPVLFNLPLILMPVHILFLQLIIDPVSAIAFESEASEYNVMQRNPRGLGEPLFDRKTLFYSFFQGASMLLVVITIFIIVLKRGQGAQDARTLCFATLTLANIMLISSSRSWSQSGVKMLFSPNRAFRWITAYVLIALSVILTLPFLRDLFHFSTLHLTELLICLLGSLLSAIGFEAYKAIYRQKASMEKS